MYPEAEKISRIIEKMGSLSPDETVHLAAVFESLENRQEAFLSNLKEEVKKEMLSDKDEEPDIYVALIDAGMREEMQGCRFSEVCPGIRAVAAEKIEVGNEDIPCGTEHSCGIIYWNADYDLIEEAISKKYVGNLVIQGQEYKVEFALRRANLFVQKEKEIQKISVQYGMERPLIYNPMARRALEVLVKFPCDLKQNEKAVISLELDKNRLSSQVILNSYLMWNISEKPFEELPSPKSEYSNEVVPLWDKTFLIYCFPVKNGDVKEYILVDHDLRAIKRVGDTIYWQLKEEYTDMTYKKYSIYAIGDMDKKKILSQSQYVFHNDYEVPPTGEIERIRTKGDAFRCASCFRKLGLACSGILLEKELSDNDVIYTYTKRLDYYQLKDGRLKTDHRCMICFDDKRDDVFFVDKVSYIIGYMNHRYPEYRWIGVR